MEKINKVLKTNIISIALSITLLLTGNVYSLTFYNDTLRLQIGQYDDTLIRIKASYLGQVLDKEEIDYLLETTNITLLLVAVGSKPAYWSWNWRGKKDEELKKIQRIAEKLDLRFVRYTPQNELCFVYNPKILATVFLQHKDWLLSREAYIGGNKYSVDDFLHTFEQIDLHVLVDYGSSREEKESVLRYLDEYLKMAGWSTTQRGRNYIEPGIIGLIMGYLFKDVVDYLELRRSGKSLKGRINWVMRLGNEIMIASNDTRAANKLADEWIRARDIVAATLGYVDFRKLQETPVFFLESQIRKYPKSFRKALTLLHLNNKVVVVKDTEGDTEIEFSVFCRKAKIDRKRLSIRTREEIGLFRDMEKIMSSIIDIDGLQCIPVMSDSRQDLVRAAALITGINSVSVIPKVIRTSF